MKEEEREREKKEKERDKEKVKDGKKNGKREPKDSDKRRRRRPEESRSSASSPSSDRARHASPQKPVADRAAPDRGSSTSSSASRRKGAALLRKVLRGGSSSSSQSAPRKQRKSGIGMAGRGIAGGADDGQTKPVAPAAAPTPHSGSNGNVAIQEGSLVAQMMGMPNRPGPDPVAIFCDANQLDVAAANALRALPPDLRQDVMAEGSVRGRNPSAILMARIRKVQSRR